MTRPRKQTVDWFPHSCNHGKTIHILEQKWGIAGYCFWFKLLELLGANEGHYLDYNDLMTASYLQAYTHFEKHDCDAILELLATLDAIDKDLWLHKIIWSQGFVNNLIDLYARRKIDLPTKENILAKKNPNRQMDEIIKQQEDCRKLTRQAIEKGEIIPGPCEICGTKDKIEPHHTDYTRPLLVRWLCKSHHSAWHNCEQNALSAGLVLAETSLNRFIEHRKLQSRVEERRGEETIVEKDIAPPGPPDLGDALFFSCKYFDVDQNYREKLAKEYPLLTDDFLRKEFSKMEDWISDNRKKKKFKANGHLANPKLFIKNWLDRTVVSGEQGFFKEPKGFNALRASTERKRGNVD